MSDAITDILIFGAGFGTRMAPLTDDRPKPLIMVARAPLIDHATRLADKAKLVIHVNAHYRAAQLQDHLRDDIAVHVEAPDILDTGGGLKSALPKMSGTTVATLNSDAIWRGPNPLDILRDAWHPRMTALLLLVPLARTIGYTRTGNFAIGRDTQLHRSADGHVYTGAQLINRDAVLSHDKSVFSLNEVWDQLLSEGKLHGVIYPGRWADVGTPQGIKLAEDMLNDTNV